MDSFASLDRIDRNILRELQNNGRITYNELAERVGLSKTPCLNRVKRLERQRFIRGYQAMLDPDRVQQGYVVYAQVKLTSTKRAMLEKFNKKVCEIPEIVSCHMMAGGYDYLLKIRTKDMKAYRDFLIEQLSTLPGIDQTSTFPVMEQVKDSSQLQIVDH